MKPEIHFDYLEPKRWEGKSIRQLYDEMNELRKKVKEAIGYQYDNSHFFINDCYGRLALIISFYEKGIHFWNAKNGCAMDSFLVPSDKNKILTQIIGTESVIESNEFTSFMSELIYEWTRKIEDGFTQCCDCKKWVKEYISYSYAGVVCKECYNPKVHLPPDTRGDG